MNKIYKSEHLKNKEVSVDIKFGDIVRIDYPDINCFERNYIISIYPNKSIEMNNKQFFFDICGINMRGELFTEKGACYNSNHITLASESEKQELFNKLAEVGKRWNPETKKLEDIRWKPKDMEEYWYITEDLLVVRTRFSKINNADILRINSNNCYKIKEAAQKVADQIKEIFKNSKAE